jgi:hypothetical protein
MYEDEGMREVLDAVSAAVPGDRMRTPVQHIAAAARSRRRMRGLAGLAGTGIAVAAGVALALPAAGAGHGAPAALGGTATLDGWTVHTEANGTVTLTMFQLINKMALQRALAAHGVPAVVYAGTTECSEADGETAPGGMRVFKPSTIVVKGRREWALDINRSAMPPRTEVLFSIVTNKAGIVTGGVDSELIYDGSPVACTPLFVPPAGARPLATPPPKS